MSSPHNRNMGRGVSSRRSAQLPAFCRSRRTQLVSVNSLSAIQRLLLLVLLFQLSTLLLLVAETVPEHHLSPLPSRTSVQERDRQ